MKVATSKEAEAEPAMTGAASLRRLGADMLPDGSDNPSFVCLQGHQFTDAEMVHLRHLAGLRWLNLFGNRVTDAGLTHLAGLTQLEGLALHPNRHGALAYLRMP